MSAWSSRFVTARSTRTLAVNSFIKAGNRLPGVWIVNSALVAKRPRITMIKSRRQNPQFKGSSNDSLGMGRLSTRPPEPIMNTLPARSMDWCLERPPVEVVSPRLLTPVVAVLLSSKVATSSSSSSPSYSIRSRAVILLESFILLLWWW